MPVQDQANGQVTFRRLEDNWERKCKRYLPVVHKDSPWRYSRAMTEQDPEQGWKIHVSATILTAVKILEKVAPFLSKEAALFKAPITLQELKKMNCGLFYGFSQVGKFMTVYPQSPEAAVRIAATLHRLTYRFHSPTVPYDVAFKHRTCVHYRYGSFRPLELENPDGTRSMAIRDPAGVLIPDLREFGAAVPDWTSDPFVQNINQQAHRFNIDSPLRTKFRAYATLSQRGKGGVYRALDLSVVPARLCIIKEGRKHGETDVDGRDGYWRVQHEEYVLRALSRAGLEVPIVYASFKVEGHYYLVTEFLNGKNLQEVLLNKKILPIRDALKYAIQIAEIVDRIHSAGWVWRDCKPLNLMVTKGRRLRPLDFEGACSINRPDKLPWGTAGYVPPEWIKELKGESRKYEDLYAVGATLHQLLTGRTPDISGPLSPIGRLRRHVPKVARQIIAALLHPDFTLRPDVSSVLVALKQAHSEALMG